jgi:hypothetical protein
MSYKPEPLNLHQEDGRLRFEQEFKAMRAQLADPNHSLVTNSFVALEWQFEQEVLKEQGPLLANPLMWDEGDQALSQWILRQFIKLADMGKRVMDIIANKGRGDPVLSYVIGRALVHHGNVWKWTQFAGRSGNEIGFANLNSLFARAIETGVENQAQSYQRDGKTIAPTLAGLYVRAHMLARVCSGNLNRQQIEIFDTWMWASMGEVQLREDHAGVPVIRFEPGGNRGLQFGPGEAASARYLPAEITRRLADRIQNDFHRGLIYPGHGATQSFRLEEHVAVLDFLRGFVEQVERGRHPLRAERVQCDGQLVEVHCGLSDILRSLSSGTRNLGPRLAPTDPSAANKIDTIYEMKRRYMALIDRSDSGLGMEVPANEASDLGVGDIISVSLSDSGEPVMGEIARIVPSTRDGVLRVGVHLSFPDCQTIEVRVAGAAASRRDSNAIYVPGPDSSGRYDVLLVSETFAQSKPLCEITLGEQAYDLRINHIREKGRGWVAAGFEVVSIREATMTDQPRPGGDSRTTLSLSLV